MVFYVLKRGIVLCACSLKVVMLKAWRLKEYDIWAAVSSNASKLGAGMSLALVSVFNITFLYVIFLVFRCPEFWLNVLIYFIGHFMVTHLQTHTHAHTPTHSYPIYLRDLRQLFSARRIKINQ